MKRFLTSFVLVALVTFGTHGLFYEVPLNDVPVVFTIGTAGWGLEYDTETGDEVFFRIGASFGDAGVTPAVTLGYNIPDTDYDVRMGLFNGRPYIGAGVQF